MGLLNPIFYFTFDQKQMSAQNCWPFLLLCQQKSTELNPGLDTMRHKAERDQSEVRLQIEAEQKRTPDRSSCHRVMPAPPAKMLLAKSVKNVSSFPKKSENCWRLHRRSAPASEADGESSHKKAEKGSMVQSDTVKYILCVSGQMHILCCLSSLNMPQLLMQDQAG